jgi:hypothetical protein
MKKLLTLLLGASLTFAAAKSEAQSIVPTHDTVWTSAPGAVTLNNFLNITSGPFKINWNVSATDFPEDWKPLFQACDNYQCYPSATLLPIGASGKTKTSDDYVNGTGDFHMLLDLSTATSYGTHYVRYKFSSNSTTDTAVETFICTRTTTGVTSMVKSVDNVVIYPNPASSELNVIFDPNADVKNMAVYNIIGKVMTVYKVTGESANLNLENVPSGIYFVRLINSHGGVVATRKFTKQ